jgi:hypothetical protein
VENRKVLDEQGAVLAQCTGKVRFESQRLAKEVADRRSRRGVRGQPYKCRHCGGYHIGKLDNPVRRNWRE